MKMLFNIIVICIATWIVTAEDNVPPVKVVEPVLPAKINTLPKEWLIDLNVNRTRGVV